MVAFRPFLLVCHEVGNGTKMIKPILYQAIGSWIRPFVPTEYVVEAGRFCCKIDQASKFIVSDELHIGEAVTIRYASIGQPPDLQAAPWRGLAFAYDRDVPDREPARSKSINDRLASTPPKDHRPLAGDHGIQGLKPRKVDCRVDRIYPGRKQKPGHESERTPTGLMLSKELDRAVDGRGVIGSRIPFCPELPDVNSPSLGGRWFSRSRSRGRSPDSS